MQSVSSLSQTASDMLQDDHHKFEKSCWRHAMLHLFKECVF